MITAENFKEKFFDEEKHIKDFVEKKLSEVLKAFEDSYVNDECSFTIECKKHDYSDAIKKELESRGFVNVRYEHVYDDIVKFWFNFDSEKDKDINTVERCSSINDYFDKYRQCNQYETEELIKHHFAEIDEQFKSGKKAHIIFSANFLNNPKPVENGIHYDIHWYLVMKVLQTRYGYVSMKRLDENFNSIEEYIESHCQMEVIKCGPKICYFKFFIYKREEDYKRDWNGSVVRLEDLER